MEPMRRRGAVCGRSWVSVIWVPLIFLAAPAAVAQVTDTVQVTGRLFYGPERTAAARHRIGIVDGPSAMTDSLGRFSFRATVGDSTVFWAQCRVERRAFGRNLGPFTIHRDQLSAVELELNRRLCIEPAETRRYGVFSGHHTSGFEMSDWALCESLLDLSDTAYDLSESWAWGTFVEGLVGPPWPDVEISDDGYYTYFMRARGTLIGPGGYGHMAFAPYLFYVDSILEVRAPEASDCEPLGPAP